MNHNENYKELANAVVLQAVRDYRHALAVENEYYIRKLEKFFRSEWFKILANLDGEMIIERLRQEKENGDDKSRTYRSLGV